MKASAETALLGIDVESGLYSLTDELFWQYVTRLRLRLRRASPVESERQKRRRRRIRPINVGKTPEGGVFGARENAPHGMVQDLRRHLVAIIDAERLRLRCPEILVHGE